MKKILMALLVFSAAFLLVACGNQNNEEKPTPHTHTYAEEWSKDANNHWHAATCEHETEVSGKAAHTWNEGEVTTQPTEDAEGVKTYACTVCGQTKTEKVDKLESTHEHTYSDEWSSNDTHHWHAATCEHEDEKKDEAEHVWDEGVVTTPATPDAEGVLTYTCECGKTKTESIEKLPKMVKVYFQNNWLWTDLHVYAWDGSDEDKVELATWPGQAMELIGTSDGKELYALEFDANLYSAFIINGINTGWEAPNNRDQSPNLNTADYLDVFATDIFYMNWNEGNITGHFPMADDATLHIHEYGTDWSHDDNNHFHACSCGLKKDETAHVWGDWTVEEETHSRACECGATQSGAHAPETKYENGYKLEVCACGKEISKVAYLTYYLTNRNDSTKAVYGHIELNEGVYSSTLTVAAWDDVTLYYDGVAISSSEVTMLPGTAWAGGAWAGVVYPLYHDGNTTGFVSPTGGDYKFTYNLEENTLLLGEYVEPVPAGTFSVARTEADAGANSIAVFATAGDVIKDNSGAYPHHPGQWDPYRLFIAVDADGKIAFMCLMPIKGYGNPVEASHARHSDYANYRENPAFGNLGDEYEGAWGTTVDWSLIVPEGGFVISAHGDLATAIGQYILNNPDFVATDNYENMVNSKNINVDSVRISYDAEAATVSVARD